MTRRGVLIVAASAALMLGHAAPASALPAIGSVKVVEQGGLVHTFEYQGLLGGEDLVVSAGQSLVYFTDRAGGTIYVSSPHCTGSNTSRVICRGSRAITPDNPYGRFTITVRGGPGNDRIDLSGAGHEPWNYLLGEGQDGDDHVVTGGRAGAHLTGGAGHDVLRGGDGQDVLDAGDGADKLYGGAAADNLLSRDSLLDEVDVVACGGNEGTRPYDSATYQPRDLVQGCVERSQYPPPLL